MVSVTGVVALAACLGIAVVLSSVVVFRFSGGAVCSAGGVVGAVAVLALEDAAAGVGVVTLGPSRLTGMMTIFLPPLENTTGLNGSSTSNSLRPKRRALSR